jgi:VCBS repeat-containing protein
MRNHSGATLTINNSTVSGNSGGSVGGIDNDVGGTLEVNNSTITGNSVSPGPTPGPGGIFAGGTETLNSTIVAGNVSNGTPSDIDFGSIDTANYNLIGDAATSGGILNGTNGNIVGNSGSGTLDIHTILDTNLAFNGGPTQTHALVCGGLAIDNGKNFAGTTTDQRGAGFARTFDDPDVANASGGDGSDIGAFEVQEICNRPPVAVDDSYSTDEDTPLSVPAPGVLGNDSDPDNGDTITAALVSGPSHAAANSFTLNADGSFSYTPSSNYNGNDSFTYKAVDSHNAESNVVTVNITINAVNDPPAIIGGSISRAQNGGSSNSQVATVSDVDNPAGSLTVTVQSAPTGITVTNIVNTNGTITADVAAGCSAATGSNTVVLQVSDGQATTNGNLTVNVTANTTAPVITPKAPIVIQQATNHGYRTFTIAQMVQSATDDCDGNVINNVVIEKATSDEVENSPGPGDGNTLNDIVIAADCKSVQLRAERDGTLNGRVYLVTLRVSDSAGNIGRATYRVSVPVGRNPAVDSGVHYTVNGTCP